MVKKKSIQSKNQLIKSKIAMLEPEAFCIQLSFVKAACGLTVLGE